MLKVFSKVQLILVLVCSLIFSNCAVANAASATANLSQNFNSSTITKIELPLPSDFAYAKYATTVGVNDYLNLRQSNSINSTSIAKIPANTTFIITADEGDWYKANYEQKIGYVSKKYVSIATKTLYIKSSIQLDNTKLLRGDKVTVVGEIGNFNIINLNKKEYVISMDNLSDTLDINDYNKEKIGEFSTKYSQSKSQTNRNTNIIIAAKTINGAIIAPNETFNWNSFVGNTTKEKGYKLAPLIKGMGYGGGICQVSSTLYNSVLQAKLEVIERHPHSHAMYYMHGKPDATIAYPTLNLVFKNTLDTPIMIEANGEKGTVKVTIYKLIPKQ